MIEARTVSQEIEAGYDPARYQGKDIIILGVHSHDHNMDQNPQDREYYYLSKYRKEHAGQVVVCATSDPEYYSRGGYAGYQYLVENIGPIENIGEAVWYPKTGYQNGQGRRIVPEQAGTQLHKVIDEKFHGKQVILLRPGTPYAGDAIVDGLLAEQNADEKYFVIDDIKAVIYQIAAHAREMLNTPESPLNFTSAPCIVKADDVSDLVKMNSLNVITATHDVYNRNKDLPESLLLRALKKLESLCPPDLQLFIASPDHEERIVTFGDFLQTVSENDSDHRETHYTLVVNPTNDPEQKK